MLTPCLLIIRTNPGIREGLITNMTIEECKIKVIKVLHRRASTRALVLIKKKMMFLEADMIDPDHQLIIRFDKNNTCQDLQLKMPELKWQLKEIKCAMIKSGSKK